MCGSCGSRMDPRVEQINITFRGRHRELVHIPAQLPCTTCVSDLCRSYQEIERPLFLVEHYTTDLFESPPPSSVVYLVCKLFQIVVMCFVRFAFSSSCLSCWIHSVQLPPYTVSPRLSCTWCECDDCTTGRGQSCRCQEEQRMPHE